MMRKGKKGTKGKRNSESMGKNREWKIQGEILLKENYIK